VAEVLYYAIPVFVLLLVMELLSFKYLRDDDLVGYEGRDTRTSLTMGGGNVVINAVWKLVVLVAYAGLYELTPLRMPADEWWTYVLLFFADDLALSFDQKAQNLKHAAVDAYFLAASSKRFFGQVKLESAKFINAQGYLRFNGYYFLRLFYY